ncbi:MAG: hypothetical protein ACRBN8_40870 [Nannocystales bacterium]
MRSIGELLRPLTQRWCPIPEPAPDFEVEPRDAREEGQESGLVLLGETEPPCVSDDACVQRGQAEEDSGNLPAASVHYRTGCDAGGVQSCQRWADTISEDAPALALLLREKACKLGSARSCHNTAEDLRETDPKRAIALYLAGCRSLLDGDLLQSVTCGRGAPVAFATRDFESARSMAETICTPELSAGCLLLGRMHIMGLGRPGDLANARAFLQLACDRGHQHSCTDLLQLDVGPGSTPTPEASPDEVP